MKNNILTLLLGLGIISQTNAQNQNDQGEILVDNFYQAKIEDASKIGGNPEVIDTIETPKSVDYYVLKKHVNTVFEPNEIPAPKLSLEDKIKKLDQHLLSIGLGLNAMPEVKYRFGSDRSRSKVYHVNIDSYNFSKERDDIKNVYSHSTFDFGFKSYSRSLTWYTGVDYDMAINNYDFSQEGVVIPWVQTVDKNQFGNGSAKIGYYSKNNDSSEVNHGFELQYGNFLAATQLNWMEHSGLLNGFVKGFVGDNAVKLNLNTQYYNHRYNGVVENAFLFNVTPSILKSTKRLKAKLGLVFSGGMESASRKSMVNPYADVDFVLIKNFMMLYGKAGGAYKRNGLSALTSQNPFISDNNLDMSFAREKMNLAFGIKGLLSKTITYNAGIRFKTVENDVLFVQSNWFANGSYNMIFDKIKYTNPYAETTHQGKKISNNLRLDYFGYSLNANNHAYMKPDLMGVWTFDYKIQDVLKIGFDALYVGKRQSLVANLGSVSDSVQELPGYADLNLSLKYNYTQKLEAYIKVFNLLNNNYEHWNGFPNQGINFLAGAAYQF